jgi:hypothetical protein
MPPQFLAQHCIIAFAGLMRPKASNYDIIPQTDGCRQDIQVCLPLDTPLSHARTAACERHPEPKNSNLRSEISTLESFADRRYTKEPAVQVQGVMLNAVEAANSQHGGLQKPFNDYQLEVSIILLGKGHFSATSTHAYSPVLVWRF